MSALPSDALLRVAHSRKCALPKYRSQKQDRVQLQHRSQDLCDNDQITECEISPRSVEVPATKNLGESLSDKWFSSYR